MSNNKRQPRPPTPTHVPPEKDLYLKNSKPGQTRSVCWEKIRLSHANPLFAYCTHCQQWMAYSKATTNLVSHAESCWLSNNKTIIEFLEKIAPDAINHAIALFVSLDLRPMSIVDGRGFKLLLNALKPKFTPPDHNVITKLMVEEFKVRKNQLKEILAATADRVALTTDLWKAINNRHFMGVTCHWLTPDFELQSATLSLAMFNGQKTAVNIREHLEKIVDEWNLTKKVIAVVADNASNNVKAFQDIIHIGCASHTVQLSVKLALERLDSLLKMCNSITEFLHRSSEAEITLFKFQAAEGMAEAKIPTAVETRWNSSYEMMQAILTHRQSVERTMHKYNRESLSLNEWQLLEEVVNFLEIPADITKQLSGSSYVSISLIYPMVRAWMMFLEGFKSESKFLLQIRDCIVADLKARWNDKETGIFCVAASMLDPRFKQLKFATKQERDIAKELVLVRMKSVMGCPEPDPKPKAAQKSKIWEFMTGANEEKEETPAGICYELELYLGSTVAAPHVQPLSYWQAHKERYPNLYHVARQLLCVPSSSVPSEALFSTAGDAFTKKRNRMSEETLEAQVFLYKNYDLISKLYN